MQELRASVYFGTSPSRHEDAVALKEAEGFVIGEERAATIRAEQDAERGFIGLTSDQRATSFGIDEKSRDFERTASDEEFGSQPWLVSQRSEWLTRHGASSVAYDFEGFINVKFARFSVFIESVVIIKPIRQIGIFLNFGDECTGPDTVHRTSGHVEHVVWMDGNSVQVRFERALL